MPEDTHAEVENMDDAESNLDAEQSEGEQDEQARAEAAEDEARRRLGSTKSPSFMIDPRKSSFVAVWDGVTALSLLFVAIVTPVEVGFLAPATSWLDSLFLFNQLINAVFVVDCLLQFILMAQISDKHGTRYVSDPRVIALHYLRGWFPIDLLSIAVSAVDYVGISSGNDDASDLRTLRVLRALRLIKLSKLISGQRLIKRYETRIAINYGAISLVRCLLGMMLLSHWMACIWGLQTSFGDDVMTTWLAGSAELCTYGQNYTIVCRGAEYQYTAAIYWAVFTITSVGYGDITATQGNAIEQVACTLLMAVGAIGWGMVLATIVSSLGNIDPEGDVFRANMTDLNKMMSREDLPNEMRARVREYYQQTVHVRFTERRSELLELMSPALQAEVAWECNKAWLQRIWFLKGASQALLVQLALRLVPHVFAPGEICPPGRMYIVHRGVALYGGRVYGTGTVWGDDCILHNKRLQHEYSARAMIFVSLFTLSREDIEEVAVLFPDEYPEIRRCTVRLALRRAFTRTLEIIRAEAVAEGVDWTQVRHQPLDVADYASGATTSFSMRRKTRDRDLNGELLTAAGSQDSKPNANETEAVDAGIFSGWLGSPLLFAASTTDSFLPMMEAVLSDQRKLSKRLKKQKNGQRKVNFRLKKQAAAMESITADVSAMRRLAEGGAETSLLNVLHA